MTYHKHGMGEVITLSFPITNNGAGVTGQSPVAAVRKKSSGQWLNDAKTAWQAGYNDITMAELDATNLPGVYTLDITHIDSTSEEYQVFYKNTGTYSGVDFESHIFTGAVYIPASSSYSTGTVRGLLDQMRNKDVNRTFDQATDSLEAQADASVPVDFTPVTNALAALQTDIGDPSIDTTSIYAQLLLVKGYVDTLETALATHEANRASMQTTLVAEHDATQAAVAALPAPDNAGITDIRDEALGKWVLDPTAKTLTLYRVDGVTVLKTFNLTDTANGVPAFIARV